MVLYIKFKAGPDIQMKLTKKKVLKNFNIFFACLPPIEENFYNCPINPYILCVKLKVDQLFKRKKLFPHVTRL